MTRTTKRVLITSELKNRCQGESAENIRELLGTLYANSLIDYTSTKEDHRYHQGYLQAIGDIVDAITTK